MPDHYKLLQVDPEAEPEVITAAFVALCAKHLTGYDELEPSDALIDQLVASLDDDDLDYKLTRKMKAILNAYLVLSDASKRSEYDRLRQSAGRSNRPRGAAAVR